MRERYRQISLSPLIGGMLVTLLISLFGWLMPQPVSADTAIVRPNGDGTITSWAKTGATTYNSQINAAVTQPTNPGTATNINIGSKTAGTAFFLMGDLAAAKTTTAITIWLYHDDGGNSTGLGIQPFDSNETTSFAASQTLTTRNGATWDSLTFSGLSLTNAQLANLRINVDSPRNGGPARTVSVYNMYASVTYTAYAAAPVADIVDASEATVAGPSVAFGSATTTFGCQTKTATLGTTTQKVHIYNDTNNQNWTLTMAPSGGTTASWTAGTKHYDFNDGGGSPAGCGDSGDTDNYAGQMSVDPSVGTVTAQSGCTTTGVTKGGATAYSEGTINNATLLNGAGAGLDCYWDLTGVNMSQTIPQATGPGSYTLNMVLTATSV